MKIWKNIRPKTNSTLKRDTKYNISPVLTKRYSSNNIQQRTESSISSNPKNIETNNSQHIKNFNQYLKN